MGPRAVLFGATGYTGRLTAHALAGHRVPTLLVGRDASRLDALVAALAPDDAGAVEGTAVVDATGDGGVEQLTAVLRPGDVLVTTVGPFARYGRTAVEAALSARTGYVDSTGEPAFLHRLFTEDDSRARAAGVAMLPAFGYDYVPGNLAAELALERAGDRARRVDVAYFVPGGFAPSSGTQASAAGAAAAPVTVLRDGALRQTRPASGMRSFTAAGRARDAVVGGGTEPYGLGRRHPGLADVTVYLGWGGRASRLVTAASAVASVPLRVPGAASTASTLARAAGQVLGRGRGEGPSDAERARARSVAVAEVFDGDGSLLARVEVEGPEPYGLTAALLTWAASRVLAGACRDTGVLGPAEAFGPAGLADGCRELGLGER